MGEAAAAKAAAHAADEATRRASEDAARVAAEEAAAVEAARIAAEERAAVEAARIAAEEAAAAEAARIAAEEAAAVEAARIAAEKEANIAAEETATVEAAEKDTDIDKRKKEQDLKQESQPIETLKKDTTGETADHFHLYIHKARNLENKDILGKSDPYIHVRFGSKEARSSTVDNTLNPEW